MTTRSLEAVVAEFLRNVLASDALGVPKLEARARAAGLLGEGQRITHAKVFKRTKKFLGIKSVRNGFGDGGEWLWRLERRPASPISKPVSSWIDGVARLDHHRPLTDIPPHRWRQFLSDFRGAAPQ
jgi:hypothetical protein